MQIKSLGRTAAVLSAALVATVLALALCVNNAYATPAAEKLAEAQAALAALNAMQQELDIASANYDQALAQVADATAKMEDAQKRIDETNEEIKGIQEKLGSRARSMYRSGTATFLDMLMGAATFQDFATSLGLLNSMNNNDADMIQQSKDLKAQVEQERMIYEAMKKLAEEKTAEALKIKEEAEATVAAIQATYESLSAEAAMLLEEERAAQAAAEAAAAEEAMRRAAEEAQRWQEEQGGGEGGGGYVEPPYSAVSGNSIVDRAYSYVGNAEYSWGACSPGQFDCSGFVSYCLSGGYNRLGSTYTFLDWNHVAEPQPGDVCVNDGHCGIYIGDGQMIHAATYGMGVVVGPVQSGMVFVRQ